MASFESKPADTSDARPLAWITGSAGLIGNQLLHLAASLAPGWRVRGLARADLDLTNWNAVRNAFQTDHPRLVIHCAALSQSPACQADPELAHRVNVEGTRFLAGLAEEIPLVFFSTDLVFGGRQGNYCETAEPNPLSVYAQTKVLAERIVLSNSRHTVIRTSLNGGASPRGNRGFNEELRNAWEAGRPVHLFVDEFRSPIAACETARAVWELAVAGVAGIYHVAGAERLSRYEIGQLLSARWPHLRPQVIPGTLKAYQGAPRPPDTSLDCSKAQAILSFRLPKFSHWLVTHSEIF